MKKNIKHRAFLVLGFCIAEILQLLSAGSVKGSNWGRVIYKEDSLYQRIFVYKYDSIVTLRFARQPVTQVQSQVNLNNLRQHLQEYTAFTFCGLLYKAEPNSVLVLGLGGGVIPREMHYYFPSAEIDVAEIDPQILQVARKYFGFTEDDKLRVHINDGRVFIKQQLRKGILKKYDIVILDAFNGDYIPFHLMTKEFLEEVKDVLSDDGVVVANVFSNNRLFDAELRTFLAVFGRCQVFAGIHSTNAMLVSPGQKGRLLSVEEAVNQAGILQRDVRFSFDMLMVANRLRPYIRPDPGARVLTDDRAPVNRLREQRNR
jgi:spermidine synthase